MGSRLIGIDRDWEAVAASRERLQGYGARFEAVHGNFFDMRALLAPLGVTAADGILLDLGVSSHQLDTAARGFSYRRDAPLDMRMDQTAPLDARDVVNGSSFEQLCRILRDYGEERYASRIASRIVQARAARPDRDDRAAAELVCAAMPGGRSREAQHPARRTFQAIRIAVNGELDGLRAAIDGAHELLAPGGRLVVLTFHSLEDPHRQAGVPRLRAPVHLPAQGARVHLRQAPHRARADEKAARLLGGGGGSKQPRRLRQAARHRKAARIRGRAGVLRRAYDCIRIVREADGTDSL